MDDGNTLGVRLRMLRRERGLTQVKLSEKSGLSVELISKLERGNRLTCRVDSLIKFASALDVQLSKLTDKHDRQPDFDRDGGRMSAIRDAILSPDLLAAPEGLPGLDAQHDGGEPSTPEDLHTAMTAGWDTYWAGDFGLLTRIVPGLISEARITERSLGPRVAGSLAQAWDLAACFMVHLGQEDLAAIASERAVNAAALGDDPYQWATVQATYAWVLLHQGRTEESERLASQVAEQIEPKFGAPAHHVAAWGNLLMAALAPAAAAGRDPVDYITRATAGAELIGGRVNMYQTTFGPASVGMQAVHANVVLHRPELALKAARKVDIRDLRGVARARHHLDVAAAHVDAKQPRAAVVRLKEARKISLPWFRQEMLARSVVEEVREMQTRLSPDVRGLARDLGL